MKAAISILFLLQALAFGNAIPQSNVPISPRIVNGVNVHPREIPFQVSLQQGYHFCGGSIVSKYWVVTAGHCVAWSNPKTIQVIVGTVNLKNPLRSHQAEKIVSHEKYDPTNSYKNDIALIKVEEPFEFSDLVNAVELPKPYVNVKANSSATVSGWGGQQNSGSPTPDRLQKTTILIADQEYCKTVMKEKGMTIYPTNICANDPTVRRGQCNGDSGGPLVVDGKLAGIVSWSIKDPDCASTKYPGVYTRVSEYVQWIYKHIS